MKLSPIALAISLALAASGCSQGPSGDSTGTETATADTASASATDGKAMNSEANPFLTPSDLYMMYPPFDRFKSEHYTPAIEQGMKEQLAEINAIATNSEAPSFENTIVAMEKTGDTLDRVLRVFYALISADTNDDLEAIRTEMAPRLSAHNDQIYLNGDLYARVKTIFDQRAELELDAESLRLVEITHRDFVRAGAALNEEQKSQLRDINAKLAKLTTQFSQNVKNEVNDLAVVVDDVKDLDGLSQGAITAAAEAAKARGMEGKYVIALMNFSNQPPLASLTNRDLRRRIHEASLSRGSRGGDYDNRAIFTEVIKLRAIRAKLLGYDTHAHFSLETQTAATPEAVNKRLAGLAPAAVRNAKKEQADLQKMAEKLGDNIDIKGYDWRFYTEKVRADRFNFDAAQLKPYLELNNVLENGVFYAAEKVFGLTFKERKDLPVYHPDVRVWEVFDADGSPLTLFIGDFYARESKRGGAWMNAYVSQSKLLNRMPVVANHQNIPKPADGEPTLMTWDEVVTMFHEFGHALHGMFSDVHYPSFAGTSVPRDFVEYPSQVNEMWADWPEVIANYAKHYETGETMPREMLDKVLASSTFNEGYKTTEYLAAAILDQAWHQLQPEDVPDADGVLEFEKNALEKAGILLDAVPTRYRTTYFSHVMGGYSAGYYAYIWSEVLDADSVEWFKENGGMKRENGDHFRKTLLSRGGSEDAMKIFKDFRGAEPNIEPLLIRRGLK